MVSIRQRVRFGIEVFRINFFKPPQRLAEELLEALLCESQARRQGCDLFIRLGIEKMQRLPGRG